MENKDMPAFPMERQIFMKGSEQVEIPAASGISKLEFIACNAPADIPGWFKHTPPAITVTPQPDWQTIEPKSDRDIIEVWFENGEELPKHLKWFSDQYEAHNRDYTAFHAANSVAKYFQWRRYYAEQLLKELEK
jgi:hypothetical protein